MIRVYGGDRARYRSDGWDDYAGHPDVETMTLDSPGGWTLLGADRLDVTGRLVGGCIEIVGPLDAPPPPGTMPEFTFPRTDRPIEASEMLLYSLEIAAPGGHWVEVSRPLCATGPSKQTAEMLEAYGEYF